MLTTIEAVQLRDRLDGHSVLIFVDHLIHGAYRSSFHASGKRTFQWGKGVPVGKRRSPSGLTAGFMKFGH